MLSTARCAMSIVLDVESWELLSKDVSEKNIHVAMLTCGCVDEVV